MQSIVYPIVYVLAFLAAVLLVQSTAGILFTFSDRTSRVNRRLTLLQSGMKPSDVYSTLLRKPPTLKTQNVRIRRVHDEILNYCQQAGLQISPTRLGAIVAGAAAAIWLLSFALPGTDVGSGLALNSLVSLFGSCVVSVLGAWAWLNRKRNARLKALEEQMPLALDIVNRGLQAGHPVVSAVQLAAHEMGDPIGSEFGLIVDETTYGYEFKDALANFASRTGSPDAQFFAISVGIQSLTGGNLAEILSGLATVIRARATLRRRVKALASEGRASALLLSALPAALVAFFAVTQPSYYTSKFSDPIFWPIVSIVFVLYLLGWIMIQRIINFKY